MPLKITKDFIHVPSGEPDSGFQKGFGRVITVDKARGIKGTIRKLKGSGKTRISSYMFPTGKFTKAQAQAWVKAHKSEEASMETQDKFLDMKNKRYPLTYPEIFETLIAFNNGELYEDYNCDQVCVYGRKLARRLSQYSYSNTYDQEYDEDGNPTSSASSGESNNTTMYKYHDGQVVVVKSKGSNDDETTWEYSDGGENENEVTFSGEEDLLEADTPGQVVKAMRNKKKMSRKDMASMMSMSAARLGEIEDGDEMDDDEISEIAGALGMTKKRLKKMISIPPKETQDTGTSEEFIEIVDEEFEIVDADSEIEIGASEEVEIADEDKPAVFESVGLYEIDGRKDQSHRLAGTILVEEIKSDGTVRFTVPIINIEAYTANGNKYSKQCAEELVSDINKLRESQREYPLDKRSSLDIRVPPQVAESMLSETFDMMPTHGPRISSAYGNPLTSKAGKIVGGFINGNIAYIVGETLRTQAGKDISVLIDEGMVKGISLVGIPKVFEKNEKKGLDVDRLQFLGGDFTDNPAMPFPEFANQESYFEILK